MPILNEASVLATYRGPTSKWRPKPAALISGSAAFAVMIAAIVTLTAAASPRIATPGPDADLQRLGHAVVANTPGAADGPAKRADTARDQTEGRSSTGKFFFGFLEFDWDPDAPGGVPGFGPLPPSPTLGVAVVKD